jgi:hypothetical protein
MVAASEGAEKVVRRVAVVHLYDERGAYRVTVGGIYEEGEAETICQWWRERDFGLVARAVVREVDFSPAA